MVYSLDTRLTLDEFVSRHSLVLEQKKEQIEFLKRTLKDLDLTYSSIPLPLSAISVLASKESTESTINEEEVESDEKKQTVKSFTPDYNEAYNFLSKLGEHEESRRRYAEERRKEYNEYLKEAKFAHSRIKSLERKAEALRLDTPIRSYAELLDEKRASEKAYRLVNDHHITHEPASLEPDFFGYNAKYHHDARFDIVNWQAKYSDTNERLVPKDRLLVTPSSRVKAILYKEELMKQIEEKHQRAEEQRRRDREEEMLIEKRSEEQRQRMTKEYEEEQMRMKRKADSLARAQKIIGEMIDEGANSNKRGSPVRPRNKDPGKQDIQDKINDQFRDLVITPTSVPRLARSPSYLAIKPPRSPVVRKSRTSLEASFDQVNGKSAPGKTSSPKPLKSTRFAAQSPSTPRDDLRSGRAKYTEAAGGDEPEVSTPNSTPEPARYNSPDPKMTPIKGKTTPQSKTAKHNVTDQASETSVYTPVRDPKDDRVLTKLTEFRKKMQEDHLRLRKQFKVPN